MPYFFDTPKRISRKAKNRCSPLSRTGLQVSSGFLQVFFRFRNVDEPEKVP